METLDAAQCEAVQSHPVGIEEVVMDKGYHSGAVLMELAERQIRSYVPEPERGQRHWAGKAEEQRCVYGDPRRVRAERSKRLQKLRGELCERSFAHCYETGAMRRVYVRGTTTCSAGAGAGGGVQRRAIDAQVKRLGQATASPGAFEPLRSLLFDLSALSEACRDF